MIIDMIAAPIVPNPLRPSARLHQPKLGTLRAASTTRALPSRKIIDESRTNTQFRGDDLLCILRLCRLIIIGLLAVFK